MTIPIKGDGHGPAVSFWATSIYGTKSRRGLVELSQTDEAGSSWRVQCSPGEARQLALSLLEAAEAAESDAIFVMFMTTRAKLPLEEVVPLLRQLRAIRESLGP